MRGKKSTKRLISADPKFLSLTVAKFINYIMQRGKKSVAQRIVYQTFDNISRKSKADPLEIFDKALRNCSPVVEVKSRRIGGANYQIPIEVRGDRRMALAMRWIITAAREKKGGQMPEKLAEEIISASENQGAAIAKRDDIYRMAESNRAFAHFA